MPACIYILSFMVSLIFNFIKLKVNGSGQQLKMIVESRKVCSGRLSEVSIPIVHQPRIKAVDKQISLSTALRLQFIHSTRRFTYNMMNIVSLSDQITVSS